MQWQYVFSVALLILSLYNVISMLKVFSVLPDKCYLWVCLNVAEGIMLNENIFCFSLWCIFYLNFNFSLDVDFELKCYVIFYLDVWIECHPYCSLCQRSLMPFWYIHNSYIITAIQCIYSTGKWINDGSQVFNEGSRTNHIIILQFNFKVIFIK